MDITSAHRSNRCEYFRRARRLPRSRIRSAQNALARIMGGARRRRWRIGVGGRRQIGVRQRWKRHVAGALAGQRRRVRTRNIGARQGWQLDRRHDLGLRPRELRRFRRLRRCGNCHRVGLRAPAGGCRTPRTRVIRYGSTVRVGAPVPKAMPLPTRQRRTTSGSGRRNGFGPVVAPRAKGSSETRLERDAPRVTATLRMLC